VGRHADAGLAAVWSSGSTGACRLAILDSGLHITYGPVSMTTSGAACSDAHVDDSTGQQLRYGRLSGDGTLPQMSVGLGQLDTSLGHYHTLQRVGQSAVALWTDTMMNRTFSAMRVCF
jgi:hypothetical protein